MKDYERIDEIIESLINSGSDIAYLEELKKKSLNSVHKDRDLKEVIDDITSEIEYITNEFLEQKNQYDTPLITGISSGIYLPDYESGNFKYTLIGGNRNRKDNEKVDFDTVFDIASITKLYTLLLIFKLEELGMINLDDKVSDVNPDFKNLGDFTFNDLIKLYGEFRTDGNIATSTSYEEAMQIFKSLYLVNDDRNKIKYNDFGSMVIGDTIEKIVSREFDKDMKLDEIMDEFLFKPLGINNTMFNPKTNNVSGNGYGEKMVHDPKSRALGGVTAHAGIFTNSEDLMKLANGLFDDKLINKEHLDRLSQINVEGASKGNMGLYVKHPIGINATYNPSEFSDKSFTAQGWTGSIASFDLDKKIHNSILVNTIIDDEKEKITSNKPEGFSSEIDKYQLEIIKRIMLIYVVKKYYNKYLDVKENLEIRKSI